MSRLLYMVKRIFGMNYRQMIDKIKEVKAKSGKSYFYIIFDMINCGIKYQAGYMDYALFEMYSLTPAQRKTVVTRGINNGFIKRFNDPKYIDLFEDKLKFNSVFKEVLHRDWLDADKADLSELEGFLSRHSEFMAKPYNGMCGKGIEKLKSSDFDSPMMLREYLKDNGICLLEEIVVQHSEMNRLHPCSVNTCRVITLLKDKKPYVVAAYLRIGNGKHVDNFNSGGMVVPVEEDTGKIIYPALNKSGELFEAHPLTGVPIKGFVIPMWDEVCKLAKKAASTVEQVGLVGWDIAVTEKGPLIIEGNDFPGHDIYGLPAHRTDGIGVLPKFEKILNS